jgi:ATP-binding cassette subfamily B (MDR/TAP) protein 1
VTFAYPKDPTRQVFKNLTMDFDINKTGLVGESGCGKSTTLQLIMRFYDPDEGRVLLDGVDLRNIDLIWLRQQIGYVGQEPVLFATSIKENLLFGKENATDEEIVSALKMAEAWDFVPALEDKLETYVGYGGGQLSGGQKQRIAIARAILRKPRIMLLDEATSALDRRNERLIQETLEKVTADVTTITVAHRVKTIMNSDVIFVLDKGGIQESGKFRDLSLFKNYVDEQDEEKGKLKEEELK